MGPGILNGLLPPKPFVMASGETAPVMSTPAPLSSCTLCGATAVAPGSTPAWGSSESLWLGILARQYRRATPDLGVAVKAEIQPRFFSCRSCSLGRIGVAGLRARKVSQNTIHNHLVGNRGWVHHVITPNLRQFLGVRNGQLRTPLSYTQYFVLAQNPEV
jgi:hypothetical protein